MVFGMIPDCKGVQKNDEYKCKYTNYPCVARTFDGSEGEYDLNDKEMARCPLYHINEISDENLDLILGMINKKFKQPSNLTEVILKTNKLD